MNGNFRVLLTINLNEVMGQLKSFWILITGSVYLLLSWLVGLHGFSFSTSPPGKDSVMLSLIHLQLYALPLLALLLSYEGVQSDRESGMLDLYLSRGFGKGLLLLGKWIGLNLGFLAALIPSFAIQAYALISVGGTWAEAGMLTGISVLLGAMMLALGLMLSSLSLNRGTVVSSCFGVWLLFAVLYDLGVLALLVGSQGQISDSLLAAISWCNPIAVFRTFAYQALFPLESSEWARQGSLAATGIITALFFWTAAPLFLAWTSLRRWYRPIPLGSN